MSTPLQLNLGGTGGIFWLLRLTSRDAMDRTVHVLLRDLTTQLVFRQVRILLPPGQIAEFTMSMWQPEFTDYDLILVTPLNGTGASYLEALSYSEGEPYRTLLAFVENDQVDVITSLEVWRRKRATTQ